MTICFNIYFRIYEYTYFVNNVNQKYIIDLAKNITEYHTFYKEKLTQIQKYNKK